ncbi:response regulator [Desulfococcaceae bacterium HSG7]|nr:response regulator [Desulfococcaceae bacterium HSG9]MDM8554226.1 response regulator [Desulfococcaceae bacterium HSG7]
MLTYKILLIDDDLLALKGIGISLERTGYHVTTTDSGERAVELLEETAFDLVLTDLVMEPLDGIDILIKAKELNPEIKVMIITGYGELSSKIDALRFHVDDFLRKPMDIEELISRVKDCLEKPGNQNKIKWADKKLQKRTSMFCSLPESVSARPFFYFS